MNDETFQYMLLLRGATGPGLFCRGAGRVSIHAPLARSNWMDFLTVTMPTRGFNTCSSCEEQQHEAIISEELFRFQYMLLLRGATKTHDVLGVFELFQYMLLLRGATQRAETVSAAGSVSIHAPLARSNSAGVAAAEKRRVSIHAPLARSNVRKFTVGKIEVFQYMLLLRGAT